MIMLTCAIDNFVGFWETKHAACFTFPKLFYALDLTMEIAHIRVEDGMFQKCTVDK